MRLSETSIVTTLTNIKTVWHPGEAALSSTEGSSLSILGANLVHKNADKRMQLMISKRTPPPVRKQMTMMMMMMKVLSPG